MSKETEFADSQRKLAHAAFISGDKYLVEKQFDKAITDLRQAINELKKIRNEHPKIAWTRQDLLTMAKYLRGLATALDGSDRLDDAVFTIRKAIAVVRPVIDMNDKTEKALYLDLFAHLIWIQYNASAYYVEPNVSHSVTYLRQIIEELKEMDKDFLLELQNSPTWKQFNETPENLQRTLAHSLHMKAKELYADGEIQSAILTYQEAIDEFNTAKRYPPSALADCKSELTSLLKEYKKMIHPRSRFTEETQLDENFIHSLRQQVKKTSGLITTPKIPLSKKADTKKSFWSGSAAVAPAKSEKTATKKQKPKTS
jgi:tetratricopeptide (TPR) repeat protein